MQAVHALSNETGTLIREDEKPLPFQAWGDVTLSGGDQYLVGHLQSHSRLPLDGGRVLHSIVWRLSGNMRQATRVASLTGQFIAYLLILIGIWTFFAGDLLNGLWFGFIGWFLLSAAQSANTQGMLTSVLRGVSVSEVMNPKPSLSSKNPFFCRAVAHFLAGHGYWRRIFTRLYESVCVGS